MTKSTYLEEIAVTSYLTGPDRKLNLYSLLNLMQDTSSKHAQILSWGHESMLKQGAFWVLTRQKVLMRSWPELRKSIQIKTWIRPEVSASSIRDFAIFIDNVQIGECSTTWVPLSAITRRPVLIDRSVIYSELEFVEPLSFVAEKIVSHGDWLCINTLKVRNSDIDQNMHVNNTRYAQWVLDSMNFDEYKNFQVMSYEVNFLGETHINDEIEIQRNQNCFRGLRIKDQKVVFIVRLNQ